MKKLKMFLNRMRVELQRERPWPWSRARVPLPPDLQLAQLEAQKSKLELEIAKDERIKQLQREVLQLKSQLETARSPEKRTGWDWDTFLKEGVFK